MSRRQTVLVVEDHLALRQFYRMALTRAGFDVCEVGDGDAALQALEHNLPDMVLPRTDGKVVRQEMAAHANTRNIPVVIVTGNTSPDIEQLGADCVLTKPATSEMLVDTVRNCLAAAAGRK